MACKRPSKMGLKGGKKILQKPSAPVPPLKGGKKFPPKPNAPPRPPQKKKNPTIFAKDLCAIVCPSPMD